MPDTSNPGLTTAGHLHPLLQRLGMSLPIVQAPMAGTATPALAAAVSNAGALGNLGLGASPADSAREQIGATRNLTGRAFGVNLFCHQPAAPDPAADRAWLQHLAPLFDESGLTPPAELHEIYGSFLDDDAMLAVLLETRPAVVSFHFGLPRPAQIQALHEAGICLMATATTLEEAQAIEAAGLDAIIAQGIEAGGHRGRFDAMTGVNTPTDEGLGTAVLVRLLVRFTRLPVIAAGGIMDGQGIRRGPAGHGLHPVPRVRRRCSVPCPPERRRRIPYPADGRHFRPPGPGHRQPADRAGRPARCATSGRLSARLRCRQTAARRGQRPRRPHPGRPLGRAPRWHASCPLRNWWPCWHGSCRPPERRTGYRYGMHHHGFASPGGITGTAHDKRGRPWPPSLPPWVPVPGARPISARVMDPAPLRTGGCGTASLPAAA